MEKRTSQSLTQQSPSMQLLITPITNILHFEKARADRTSHTHQQSIFFVLSCWFPNNENWAPRIVDAVIAHTSQESSARKRPSHVSSFESSTARDRTGDWIEPARRQPFSLQQNRGRAHHLPLYGSATMATQDKQLDVVFLDSLTDRFLRFPDFCHGLGRDLQITSITSYSNPRFYVRHQTKRNQTKCFLHLRTPCWEQLCLASSSRARVALF